MKNGKKWWNFQKKIPAPSNCGSYFWNLPNLVIYITFLLRKEKITKETWGTLRLVPHTPFNALSHTDSLFLDCFQTVYFYKTGRA